MIAYLYTYRVVTFTWGTNFPSMPLCIVYFTCKYIVLSTRIVLRYLSQWLKIYTLNSLLRYDVIVYTIDIYILFDIRITRNTSTFIFGSHTRMMGNTPGPPLAQLVCGPVVVPFQTTATGLHYIAAATITYTCA